MAESIAEIAPVETWCHAGFSLDDARDYIKWWMNARARKLAFSYAVEDAASALAGSATPRASTGTRCSGTGCGRPKRGRVS